VTRGTATIVRLADRRTFLTLTSFSTSPGPDLRVRLASSRTLDGGASGAVDLGALKGNRGDQQYRIPPGVSLRGRAVVIWCRAFSARFGSATLRYPPALQDDRLRRAADLPARVRRSEPRSRTTRGSCLHGCPSDW
jgi:hypothetical protein